MIAHAISIDSTSLTQGACRGSFVLVIQETKNQSRLLMNEPSKFIHELLIERKAKNSRYSARALARDLGLSQGFLSQVMNGVRTFSLQQKFKIAGHLGLDLISSSSF